MIKDPETSVKAIANLALGKMLRLLICWLETCLGPSVEGGSPDIYRTSSKEIARRGQGTLFSSSCYNNSPVATTEMSESLLVSDMCGMSGDRVWFLLCTSWSIFRSYKSPKVKNGSTRMPGWVGPDACTAPCCLSCSLTGGLSEQSSLIVPLLPAPSPSLAICSSA